jgi:hypothetical protein
MRGQQPGQRFGLGDLKPLWRYDSRQDVMICAEFLMQRQPHGCLTRTAPANDESGPAQGEAFLIEVGLDETTLSKQRARVSFGCRVAERNASQVWHSRPF